MNKRATPSLTANILRSDADVVEAIHVVQTEMGITGTTAKEAGTTIEGSIGAAKAAWQNFLLGLSSPVDFPLEEQIDNLVGSVVTAFGNILPVVLMVLESIGTAIQDFAPVLAETLPTLIEDVLPSMLEAGVSLVAALVSGLGSALPYGTLSLTLNNATRRFDPGAKDSIFRSLEERQTIKVYIGVTLPDESAALAPVGAYYQYQNGNPIVDILLGEKLGLAKEIAAEVSLILPKPCGIDDFDLCVLFANALDNAIEAAQQVPDQSERTVALTIRRIHQMLVIKVENSFAAALVSAVLRPGSGAGGALPAGTAKGVLHSLLPLSLRVQSGCGHHFSVQLAAPDRRDHTAPYLDGGLLCSAERGRLRPAGVVLPHTGMENRKRSLASPAQIRCASHYDAAGRAGGYVLKDYLPERSNSLRQIIFQKDGLL